MVIAPSTSNRRNKAPPPPAQRKRNLAGLRPRPALRANHSSRKAGRLSGTRRKPGVGAAAAAANKAAPEAFGRLFHHGHMAHNSASSSEKIRHIQVADLGHN